MQCNTVFYIYSRTQYSVRPELRGVVTTVRYSGVRESECYDLELDSGHKKTTTADLRPTALYMHVARLFSAIQYIKCVQSSTIA